MSDDGTRFNRLAESSSPYLLLHRHNPVDWYPWGEEAIERARREDRPIFLSVGYSTCYWCHVMERESFSDDGVAELMNREFVNIKVDREERPDLDEIYMAATQILTGHGGWPNSLFLTPELKPFFAGTYFPPADRPGLPGFSTVLHSLAAAWKERREDVEKQADEVAAAVRRYLEERGKPGAEIPGADVAERALESLAVRYDRTWGGFGGAPKFPTPSHLYLLLEMMGERPEAAEMLGGTLDRMARGGIYDQLAGGFHRYATDREWKIPHFEKMLYDNGLLLEIYARQWGHTGDAETARVAGETADFLAVELTSPEGGLWSAIDAETDGAEGAYYVWTRAELEEVLGPEDFGFLAPILGFDGAPFFEDRHYVLHLPLPLDEQAQKRRMSRRELLAEIHPLRQRLLAARGRRRRPLTDDKILADWNGMAISGLACAGELLERPDLIRRAASAAGFVLSAMRPAGGPLLHAWRAGSGTAAAFLADYAFLVRGLLALHHATGADVWLGSAAELTAEQAGRLADPAGGFFVAAESPDIIARSKEAFDGAVPAANAVAALNLLELAKRTDDSRWRSQAEATVRAFGATVERHPEAAGMLTLAVRRSYAAPTAELRSAPARTSAGAEPGSPGLEQEPQGVVEVATRLGEPGPEGWRAVRLTLEIAPGWHLTAHGAGDRRLRPIEISPRGCELTAVDYPEGEPTRLGSIDDEIILYRGRIDIAARVRLPDAGQGRLLLSYQACDARRCLQPVTVEIPLVGRQT